MMKMPFDQYQRYKNTEKIIQSIRDNNQTFSLLEVGANSHKNLEKFLPQDKVTYLDIELPEELKNDPSYILGDATNLEGINDNSFDIVVALDVLEHIPFEKRDAFFKELYRVSKKLVIICAPFQSQKIHEAEVRLNQFHKSLYTVDFIWLKEHIQNTLPELTQTLQMLKAGSIDTFHFPHGELELWERLMRLHLMVVGNPSMSDYRFLIDEYYNSYIFENDYVENAYRHFVLCLKETTLSTTLSNIFISKANLEPAILNKFEDLEKSLTSLYTARALQNSNPENSENIYISILNHLGINPEEFNRITRELSEKNTTLLNLQTQLLEAREQLNQVQCQLEKTRTYLILNRINPDTGFPLYDLSLTKLITKLARKCLPSWLKRLVHNIWIKINR